MTESNAKIQSAITKGGVWFPAHFEPDAKVKLAVNNRKSTPSKHSILTSLQLHNAGHELFDLPMLSLDLVEQHGGGPQPPPCLGQICGRAPNAGFPGDQATATMERRAGNYALMCLIPDQTGVPHAALGMVKPLDNVSDPVHFRSKLRRNQRCGADHVPGCAGGLE